MKLLDDIDDLLRDMIFVGKGHRELSYYLEWPVVRSTQSFR